MKPVALTVTTGEKDISGRELLFNLIPVKSTGGKYPFKLVSAPGKSVFTTLPTGPVLGMIKEKATGRGFAATATNLYELSPDGTATDRGSWTLTGRASMATNGVVIAIVDGSTGWIFTLATNTLAQITDPDFYPSDRVQFLDGFFVFNRTGTGQYFISSLYGTDFDALDFATAEGDPDNIATIIADHREIFLLGTDSTEAIYNAGGEFPFARNPAVFVEKGCAAKYTTAKANNSVYFVGSDLIVYEMRGYTPDRISTDAIEQDLQDTPLDDAFAYTYHEQGQIFYVLTMPTRLRTWVFETQSRTWHQRSSYQDGAQGRDVSNTVMFWQNKTLVSDWQNNNIYHLSRSYHRELSQPIVRRVRLPTITNARRFFTLSAVEFDMKRGVGKVSGSDSDPLCWLRYSRDGGNTWINHPDQPSLGKLGEFYKRIRFDRLGRGREFDLELNISHGVDVEIGGAFVDAS